MKANAVFRLMPVLAGFLLGRATSAHQSVAGFSSIPIPKLAAGGDWQETLLKATTNGAWMVGSARFGVQYYSVPQEAAKILENRPPAEVLPVLAKLRLSAPRWKADVLDVWTGIVRKGLHGTPYTITNSYALCQSRGLLLPIFSNIFYAPGRMQPTPPIFTNWISVYNYTDCHARPVRANVSAGEQDILKVAEKSPLDIRVEGQKISKYGDPELVQAVQKLSDIPRPWTVPQMIGLFEKETGERAQFLAKVLAASHDPRAALALGKALDDPGFYKAYAANSALFDYFVGDDTYGLPPENHLVIWAGNGLDLTIPAAHRWWIINRSQLETEVAKMHKP